MRRDWARYWRSADQPVEAMHAHFERHVYHRHSHDTYSFGVTEHGLQSFVCRGARRTSAAGMVIAFNPEDPHDGRATDALGFTYRIVHLGPDLVADALADAAGRRVGAPLFADPVLDDPVLAGALRRLHGALFDGATALRRDELLTSAVLAAARRASRSRPPSRPVPPPEVPTTADAVRLAARVRELLDAGGDPSGSDLAALTGRSRFAVYRAFRSVYGLAPSEYQRQARLRTARRMVADGRSIATVAADLGFTDQSHLTRWFTRYFGITPSAYRRAASASVSAPASAPASTSASAPGFAPGFAPASASVSVSWPDRPDDR